MTEKKNLMHYEALFSVFTIESSDKNIAKESFVQANVHIYIDPVANKVCYDLLSTKILSYDPETKDFYQHETLGPMIIIDLFNKYNEGKISALFKSYNNESADMFIDIALLPDNDNSGFKISSILMPPDMVETLSIPLPKELKDGIISSMIKSKEYFM